MAPDTIQRQGQAYHTPSLKEAVYCRHSPEPVLREEASHRNVIFIDQVLLLQDLHSWGTTVEGHKERAILLLQVFQAVPQPHPVPHLGQGPPGPGPGSSCAGPQQTGSRTGRAPGRPAAAHGPLAARRSAAWAAVSAHPGSSAWLLGKYTGPLQGQVRVSIREQKETHIPHPDL